MHRIARSQALVESHKPIIAMIPACVSAVECRSRSPAIFASRRAGPGLAFLPRGSDLRIRSTGVNMLTQTVGPANARDILLSARLFDADEALHMGLVNRVVDSESLKRTFATMRLKMATNAPLTMAAAKVAIRESLQDREERDVKTVSAMVVAMLR